MVILSSMAGPPPAIGPMIFRTLRATAYDLPEDFVTRLEPGLDEITKASLAAGMRAVRLIRGLWTWILVLAGLGGAGLLVASMLGPNTGPMLGIPSLAVLGFALMVSLVLSAMAVVHRRDIHRLEAFAEAMRGSSLARDIA